jgi:hypothetical protein
MLLVLDRDNCLDLFESVEAAEKELETIDIENKEYEICDDTGQRFVGDVLAAATTFGAGRFRLVPAGPPEAALPFQIVTRAQLLGGPLNDLKNIEDLRRKFSTQS